MLMTPSRLLLAAVAATGAAALSGCASYDPYGGGYSSVSIGVGTGGYYGGGYGGGFGGYGYYPAYGYAQPWGGWYNDYYYPGRGSYVYDRNRRAVRWNDGQRRYWEQRR